MPRPCKQRNIRCKPDRKCFKPRGIPMDELETMELELDELEALRLADQNGLYHQQAAQAMEISRQTFGNILASARKKVATALLSGAAIVITGADAAPHQNGS